MLKNANVKSASSIVKNLKIDLKYTAQGSVDPKVTWSTTDEVLQTTKDIGYGVISVCTPSAATDRPQVLFESRQDRAPDECSSLPSPVNKHEIK